MSRRALRLSAFRPSSADQWVNCPAAARVNYIGQFIEDKPNPAADEGTEAHAYLEALLTAPSEGAVDVSDQMKRMVRERFPGVPDESTDLLETVADDVYWLKNMGGFRLLVEQSYPIKIAGETHECTIDILLINETNAMIIDLKWGMGKPVRVARNNQIMLYSHAVAAVHPGLSYQLGVYQPRGIGTGLDTWVVPARYMVDSMIAFQAAGERASQMRVEYVPGDHCQWCDGRIKGVCPRFQMDYIDLAVTRAEELDDSAITPPWWVLDHETQIRQSLDKVGQLADAHLSVGRTVPGWAWGTKKGKSRWVDESTVAASLAGLLGGEESDYRHKPKPPGPIGITDAKRIARKRRVSLEDLIKKPTRFVRVKADTSADLGVTPIE